MIGQAVRHGRTRRDAFNLRAHLLKDARATFVAINSVAPDLEAIMSDMLLARDGSRAQSAFLHISLSPARDMSDDELRQAAAIVMKHFGACDNQAALIIHGKDRVGGKGNSHAHLVLGRVSPDSEVISSGFEKIRLETAMRIAEYEMNEPAILGRHHESCVKWLRSHGRSDVADFIVAAHGETPLKPTSRASPSARQMIERTTGRDLASITHDVQSAWEKSDNGQSFSTALMSTGLTVKSGKKEGVFVVCNGDQELGALDRILKIKRTIVKIKMGEVKNDNTTATAKEAADTTGYIQRSQIEPSRHSKTIPIVEPTRTSRATREWPDRANPAITGGNSTGTTTSDVDDGSYGKENRYYEQKTCLIALDKVRLSSESVLAGQALLNHKVRKNITQFETIYAGHEIESHKYGWGWVRRFREELIEKLREIHQRHFRKNERPESHSNENDPENPHEHTGPQFK